MDRVYRPGWETIDQPIYDRQVYPSQGRVDRLHFFENPVGSLDGIKTYTDTNMVMPSTLPAHQQFLVCRVSITMPRATDDERMRLYWSASLALVLGNKLYLRLPLVKLALEPYTLDEKARLLIPEGMPFDLELHWPTSPVLPRSIDVCAELGGYLYRRAA